MATPLGSMDGRLGSTELEADLDADLRHVMEILVDGVLFLDRSWRVTFANESARQISRIGAESLNGPTHWELFPATVGSELQGVYERSMNERVSLEFEHFYEPFQVWLALRTMPIPSGIAVVYRDVSRLREAELRRDENQRQLQQVLEATTDAVMLLDRGYNISFLNRRAQELLAAQGEVLGKNLWETFPNTVYEGSPYVRVYRQAMDESVGENFEAYYPEPFNFWLSIEALPTESGVIVFFRDVTEQRAAAEELMGKSAEAERQKAEIEAMYRTAPIGLALFDPEEFRYLRLNDRQAAFFGLKPDEILGRTLTEMAPIEGLRELFEGVRAGVPVVNFPLEGEVISRPGEHRYWTVNYFPVYAADGTVQAISAASLEITAQKKAERALIQSEKLAAVGRLASSISHEINNPLEAITNLLYLVAAEQDLPPAVRGYVEQAQAETARVSQIAVQTLRFHRQASRPTRVTAAQLVEPVVTLYRARLMNAGIVVEMTFTDDGAILCLENEIRQVVSNLISNAVDAMRSGGRLMLRSHRATDWATGQRGLRMVFADTGHGMSEATRAKIFEPFFTTKDLNGTGLGLWISAEIIQRHQGRLTLRSSDGPGRQGTVFGLFLPFARENQEQASTS